MSGAVENRDGFMPPPAGEFLGHPKALWNLFASEFWERFMYYGMRAMLAVHIAAAFFAHLGDGARAEASLTYGGFTSLVYMTGIAGGFVADPDGEKNPMESGNILATNADLLPQFKDALSKAREA